jgi:hypothetical protein
MEPTWTAEDRQEIEEFAVGCQEMVAGLEELVAELSRAVERIRAGGRQEGVSEAAAIVTHFACLIDDVAADWQRVTPRLRALAAELSEAVVS